MPQEASTSRPPHQRRTGIDAYWPSSPLALAGHPDLRARRRLAGFSRYCQRQRRRLASVSALPNTSRRAGRAPPRPPARRRSTVDRGAIVLRAPIKQEETLARRAMLWPKPGPMLSSAPRGPAASSCPWPPGCCCLLAFAGGLQPSGAPLFLNLGRGRRALRPRLPRRLGARRPAGQRRDACSAGPLDGARLELPGRGGGRAAARAPARWPASRGTPADAARCAPASARSTQWRQPPRGWRVRDAGAGRARGPLDAALPLGGAGRRCAGRGARLGRDRAASRGLRRTGAALAGAARRCSLGVPAARRASWRRGARRRARAAPRSWQRWPPARSCSTAWAAWWRWRTAGAPGAAACCSLLDSPRRVLAPRVAAQPRAVGGGAGVSAALAVLACVALVHPFFHYPDVDTHARFLRAIRQDACWPLDPTALPGAHRRLDARRSPAARVAFPTAPVFHVAGRGRWPRLCGRRAARSRRWPRSPSGLTRAARARAGARSGPRAGRWRCLAQVAARGPARDLRRASRWPSIPTLLGPGAGGAAARRTCARASTTWTARAMPRPRSASCWPAQLAYTGSLFNVAALVVVLAAVLEAARRRAARACGRLLAHVVASLGRGGCCCSTRASCPSSCARCCRTRGSAVRAAVAATEAAARPGRRPRRHLLRRPSAAGGGGPALAARRARAAAARPRSPRSPRAWRCCVLRYALPALFRDAKEVELLALPPACCRALAAGALWARGRAGRVSAVALVVAAAAWCLARDVVALRRALRRRGR